MITDILPGETFGHRKGRKDIRKIRSLRIEEAAWHGQKAEKGLWYVQANLFLLKFFQGPEIQSIYSHKIAEGGIRDCRDYVSQVL